MLAYRVDDIADAAEIARRVLAEIDGLPPLMREQFAKGVLLEEHLAGDLVSAEIGAVDGEYHHFMISGRIRARHNECLELGAFMPSQLPHDETAACFDYAVRTCATLGLDIGIFHIEMIATTRGPVLVEANPRLMGGVMPSLYANVTGFNIRRDLIDIHVDRTLPAAQRHPRRFVTTRKVMTAEGGRLSTALHLDWLRAHDKHLVAFDDYLLRPGREVAELTILARFQVTGTSPDHATDVADTLLDSAEEAIGLPLVHRR
jgi:biotin carboxylase